MSKPRNRLPDPPPQPPEPKPASNGPLPEAPKPAEAKLRNALQELKRPAPCCASCCHWHRSNNNMQDQTCRRYPPAYMNGVANCRVWPHTLGTDGCGEWLERLQSLPGAPGGVLGAPGLKSAV